MGEPSCRHRYASAHKLDRCPRCNCQKSGSPSARVAARQTSPTSEHRSTAGAAPCPESEDTQCIAPPIPAPKYAPPKPATSTTQEVDGSSRLRRPFVSAINFHSNYNPCVLPSLFP